MAAHLKASLAALTFALLAVSLPAQEKPPADPLEFLKQHDQLRAAASQPAGAGTAQLQLGSRPAGSDLALRTQTLALTLRQEQVQTSIRKGSNFLLARLQAMQFGSQGPSIDQRVWTSFAGDQSVGVVALMVHALIESGRVNDDPRLHPLSKELAPAVSYLSKARTRQTYSAALQAVALASLPPRPEYRAALKRVRDDLAFSMHADGGFDYTLAGKNHWDNSNTQFALLGMWAASESGVEVPLNFWQTQEDHWRRLQSPAGGWGYQETVRDFKSEAIAELKPLPSLTAAGLASLYVITDQLSSKRPSTGDKGLDAGLTQVEADLKDSRSHLAENLYYLYAVQRVGVATGRKMLGGVDWYRQGAAALITAQHDDGAWTYAGDLPGTSLSLLFLAYGGAPVAFNVLEYGQPGEWDPQPRAAAKLTRWIGRSLERPLNWQVVSIGTDPAQWMDAPILLISGERDPNFSPNQLEKLRTYMQRGGMILSIGDSPDGPFSIAMKKAAVAAVENGYGLRKLPPEHPFFNVSAKLQATAPPELWALSNGNRELWVHSSANLAQAWQNLAYSESDQWQLPLNILRCATGEERPRDRLDTLAVTPPVGKLQRTIAVARLRYKGNWDPEPLAWPRFTELMAADAATQLTAQPTDIARLNARATPVAHLTGTTAFALDNDDIAALLDFLKAGGTLIADASSDDFNKSFQALATALTGTKIPDMLRGDSPIMDASIPGSVKIIDLQFRKGTPADRRIITDRPQILAWKLGERPAILLSPLDCTSGFLGTETSGIAGYRPVTAQQVARNMILYAASSKQ